MMPEGPKESDPDQDDRPNPLGVAMGAGAELVVFALLGFFAGQWLDKKLKTGPWLMLVGAMGGITVGLYQLIKATAIRRGRR